MHMNIRMKLIKTENRNEKRWCATRERTINKRHPVKVAARGDTIPSRSYNMPCTSIQCSSRIPIRFVHIFFFFCHIPIRMLYILYPFNRSLPHHLWPCCILTRSCCCVPPSPILLLRSFKRAAIDWNNARKLHARAAITTGTEHYLQYIIYIFLYIYTYTVPSYTNMLCYSYSKLDSVENLKRGRLSSCNRSVVPITTSGVYAQAPCTAYIIDDGSKRSNEFEKYARTSCTVHRKEEKIGRETPFGVEKKKIRRKTL